METYAVCGWSPRGSRGLAGQSCTYLALTIDFRTLPLVLGPSHALIRSHLCETFV